MEKAYKSIIVLVTLSLLSLILIQISSINNAILVEKGKYNEQVSVAFNDIKQGIKELIAQNVGYNPEKLAWEGELTSSSEYLWATLQHIPNYEINGVIKENLKKQKIDLPFEYKISGPMPWVLSSSDNFTEEMSKSSKLFKRALTYDDTYKFSLYIYEPENYIIRRTWMIIFGSILFTCIILSAFYITVRTVLRQKKLAEMKTDFINNMTHEFKTPLATIQLAVDALQNDIVKADAKQLNFYTGIIKEENIRLNKQVAKILETSVSEDKELKINLQKIDVHEVIKSAANNIVVRMSDEEGVIDQFLNAKMHEIYADEVHFANIITNLLENAIKYSKDPRHIIIETQDSGGGKGVIIKIKDNGIGMSKDTVAHIFEKFYRAHTGDLHNVKGFGLGLSYVKSVVDAHSAKIKVESTVGKGSTFIIEFSFMPKKKKRRNG